MFEFLDEEPGVRHDSFARPVAIIERQLLANFDLSCRSENNAGHFPVDKQLNMTGKDRFQDCCKVIII